MGVDWTPETLCEKTLSTMDSIQQIYATNQTPLSQTFWASLELNIVHVYCMYIYKSVVHPTQIIAEGVCK